MFYFWVFMNDFFKRVVTFEVASIPLLGNKVNLDLVAIAIE